MKYAVVAAIIVAVVAVVIIRSDERVLADDIGITVYGSGSAMVQVPYRLDATRGTMTVAIDTDDDGVFTDDETVVRNFPARPQKYWNSNYFFMPTVALADKVAVQVSFGNETIRKTVSVSRSTGPAIQESLIVTTRPEESMKGETAIEPVIAQREAEVPDLQQRTDECAPTAAANSLISLAKEHGMDDRLPADSLTMVDELKGEMLWTPADGVVPDNFIAGKNRWAAQRGLPITTALVGNTRGKGTIDALAASLASGGAGELRLRFGTPVGNGGYQMSGGHLLTIVGVTKNDFGTFIDVNDPLTPSGTETYKIDDNGMLIGYPRGVPNGVAFVGLGFTQTWTGTALDPMTSAEVKAIRDFAGEKRHIKALHIGDRYIPLEQVHISQPDLCDGRHWHANGGGVAHDTNGKIFPEIFEHCGFGKEDDVPVVDVDVP